MKLCLLLVVGMPDYLKSKASIIRKGEKVMEENKRKISFWEGMKRNNRAWKIWWKLCPGVFLSSLLSSIFQALSPYVTIWLSAQIINELAGNRNPERLLRFIIAQLLSALVLALVNGVLNRWNRYEQDLANRIDDRIYMNKMLSLDYADID